MADNDPIDPAIFGPLRLYEEEDGHDNDDEIPDGDLQLSDQNNLTLAANLTAEESKTLNQRHKISGSEQKQTTQF